MRQFTFLLAAIFCFLSFSQNTFEVNTALKKQLFASQIDVKNLPAHKSITTFELNQRILTNNIEIGDHIIFHFENLSQKTAKVTAKIVDINQVTSLICKFDDMMFSQAFITFDKDEYLLSIDLPEHNRKFKTMVSTNRSDYYMVELDTNNLDQLGCAGDIIVPEIEKKTIKTDTKKPATFSKVKPACCLEDHHHLTFKSSSCQSLTADDPADIKILIIYTQASLNYAGSQAAMNNIIAQAMLRANNASINSTLGMNFILAHSELTDYVESSSGSDTDLNRLRVNGDGHMDNVHTLRNTYAVDFVHLISFVNDTGGIAYLLQNRNGRQDLAFGLTRVQQADWTDTFIHELGHNMSASHAAGQNIQAGPTDWNDWPENGWTAGWRFQGNNGIYYSDLMTYGNPSSWNDGIGSTNISYFSNPLILFQGQPMGNAVTGDNTRSLKAVKQVVSKYRDENTLLYCTASGNNASTSNIFISTVNLNGINHASSWAAFNDYSYLKASLEKGSSYPLTINTANTIGSCQLLVWTDWNEDGDFNDVNEQVYVSTISNATQFTTNIAPPLDATIGEKRMRVRFHFTGSGANNTACGSSSFGEVEDYIICLNEQAVELPAMANTTCNTTFNVVPGETIAANPVAGATNYRFKFVDEVNEEYLVERETGSMTIHQFAEFIDSGFQYNQTYQASVEAYVDDAWTGYGASCEFFITDDPRTKLRADFCDLPLAAMDTRIFVDRLPLFNQYVYTVLNTSTNQSVTFTKTDPQATGFRLTQEAASILTADTTYEVTVKAKLGDWEATAGQMCTVSTPAIPGTVKLRAGSCDVTLTSMINQAVLSEVVSNAVEYQFEVTNTTLNTAPVTFLKSNWVLPMSDLGAGFTNNTTYSIRVRARVGSTFNSYGTPCTVTTPSTVPAPQLTALYCDQTFENYRSLYANRVVNSQEFTFEVTNDQSEETIEVVRPGNFFHLANHTSAAFLYDGTSFTIRVKVKVNDTYGDYGTPCVVTIGAPSLLNYNLDGVASSDKIEVYPNPFNNQFTIKLTDLTTANIQVFDINGRLVENQTINDTFEVEMGLNLNAGVYLVRVEQNGDTQSFKMIKK